MAKLRATMVVEYEVTDQELHENYGTLDPHEAAIIDQTNMEDDPGLILNIGETNTITVEVVE